MLPPFELNCPQCGADVQVRQTQGDRCPGCHFEFKRFELGEERTAQDFLVALTGSKHLVQVPQRGWIIAHE